MFTIRDATRGTYVHQDLNVASPENPQGFRATPDVAQAEQFETREQAEAVCAGLQRQFAAIKFEVVEV